MDSRQFNRNHPGRKTDGGFPAETMVAGNYGSYLVPPGHPVSGLGQPRFAAGLSLYHQSPNRFIDVSSKATYLLARNSLSACHLVENWQTENSVLDGVQPVSRLPDLIRPLWFLPLGGLRYAEQKFQHLALALWYSGGRRIAGFHVSDTE